MDAAGLKALGAIAGIRAGYRDLPPRARLLPGLCEALRTHPRILTEVNGLSYSKHRPLVGNDVTFCKLFGRVERRALHKLCPPDHAGSFSVMLPIPASRAFDRYLVARPLFDDWHGPDRFKKVAQTIAEKLPEEVPVEIFVYMELFSGQERTYGELQDRFYFPFFNPRIPVWPTQHCSEVF